MRAIESLEKILPQNPVDQLVVELGGSESVADLTGRKRAIIQSYEAAGEVGIIVL